MKNQYFGQIILILLLLFSFSSCEKDAVEINPNNVDQSTQMAIKSLVDDAGSRYLEGEVILSENNETLLAGEDGLIDEYTADETGFKESSPRNKFLSCVRSVEPDREQRQKLGRAFSAYSARNQRIIRSHRENMLQLKQRVMTAHNQLYKDLEAGEINREQYRQKVQALRERFQEAVNRIRASHVETFSRSYSLMLEQLRSIISQEQWNSFIACMSA